MDKPDVDYITGLSHCQTGIDTPDTAHLYWFVVNRRGDYSAEHALTVP
jgi:hypothetical protein